MYARPYGLTEKDIHEGLLSIAKSWRYSRGDFSRSFHYFSPDSLYRGVYQFVEAYNVGLLPFNGKRKKCLIHN